MRSIVALLPLRLLIPKLVLRESSRRALKFMRLPSNEVASVVLIASLILSSADKV